MSETRAVYEAVYAVLQEAEQPLGPGEVLQRFQARTPCLSSVSVNASIWRLVDEHKADFNDQWQVYLLDADIR